MDRFSDPATPQRTPGVLKHAKKALKVKKKGSGEDHIHEGLME
jgi:hypothetical protein